MPTENNPAVIYLGPACETETGDGRTWAEDWPWPDCECGHQPVQYVLGETFNRVKAEREALQQRLTTADEFNDTLRANLAKCKSWIESAREGVIYPVARDFAGVVGHNAEGLGRLSVSLLAELDAALNPTPKPTCCGRCPAGCIGAKP